MGKVIPRIAEIVRVGSTDLLTFEFNLNLGSETADGTLTFRLSDTADFATSTLHTPSSYEYYNGTAWTNVGNNTFVNANKLLPHRAKLPAINGNKVKYVKAYYTKGATEYQSPIIMFTSVMQIKFSLKTPIDLGTVKPTRVKVSDVLKVQVASGYSVRIDVCNNAFDTAPTYENMSAKYINADWFDFTNTAKEAAKNWGINVIYTITKANATDQIEVSNISVAYL